MTDEAVTDEVVCLSVPDRRRFDAVVQQSVHGTNHLHTWRAAHTIQTDDTWRQSTTLTTKLDSTVDSRVHCTVANRSMTDMSWHICLDLKSHWSSTSYVLVCQRGAAHTQRRVYRRPSRPTLPERRAFFCLHQNTKQLDECQGNSRQLGHGSGTSSLLTGHAATLKLVLERPYMSSALSQPAQ